MEMVLNGNYNALENGVRMGNDFLSSISAPAPLKEFTENSSRLEHGKRVVYANPKLQERDVTLNFTIQGKDENDFLSKKKMFEEILYAGLVRIYIPAIGETYRLTYLCSTTYGQNWQRTFCNIAVKFNEPDPSNRSND